MSITSRDFIGISAIGILEARVLVIQEGRINPFFRL